VRETRACKISAILCTGNISELGVKLRK